MRSNAIFTPEGYPRRNPALPLASVVTTACESVPRSRTVAERIRSGVQGDWLLAAERVLRPRSHAIFSTFN